MPITSATNTSPSRERVSAPTQPTVHAAMTPVAKTRIDFATLALEVRVKIARYLPGRDAVALGRTSWAAHEAIQDKQVRARIESARISFINTQFEQIKKLEFKDRTVEHLATCGFSDQLSTFKKMSKTKQEFILSDNVLDRLRFMQLNKIKPDWKLFNYVPSDRIPRVDKRGQAVDDYREGDKIDTGILGALRHNEVLKIGQGKRIPLLDAMVKSGLFMQFEDCYYRSVWSKGTSARSGIHCPEQIKRLFDAGMDVHQIGRMHRTPLHYMVDYVFCGRSRSRTEETDLHKAIQLLLEKGLDPNQPDAGGNTPLHLAINCGNVTAVRLLLNAGADPLRRDASRKTAMHLAIDQGEHAYAMLDAMIVSLKRTPPDVGIDTPDREGRTVLDCAARRHRRNVVQLLVRNGADPAKVMNFDPELLQEAPVLIDECAPLGHATPTHSADTSPPSSGARNDYAFSRAHAA